MLPLADSHIQSDQNGYIAIQLEQKNTRYRLKVIENGAILLTPDPVAAITEAPKEAAPKDQQILAPSFRAFVPSESPAATSTNDRTATQGKTWTDQAESARRSAPSSSTTTFDAGNRAPTQSSGTIGAPLKPESVAATQSPKETLQQLQRSQEPSTRSVVQPETRDSTSISERTVAPGNTQTPQTASTRTATPSSATTATGSSNRAPHHGRGSSSVLATPEASTASQPASSGSEGWLQLNREAMLLLRGRGTSKS